MDKPSCENFKMKLEELQEFPCTYPFKFIVPAESVGKAMAMFPEGTASKRASKTGKYVSVSADLDMQNAEEIVAIYQKACSIPGIMAL